MNRTPIAGKVTCVTYKKGEFLVASKPEASSNNERNIITVEGEVAGRRTKVVFSQIAGLIARRIVFNFRVGDQLACGERVGLIKFGSRVDVLFDRDAAIEVKVGDRVRGGASVLALLPATQTVHAGAVDVGGQGASRGVGPGAH